MNHKEKTMLLHKELKETHPDIDSLLVKHFIENMPDEAYVSLLFFQNEADENYHISNKKQYETSVELFEWVEDKGTGAKWSCEDILKLANINFENKEYTKYDFCYQMNMLYSDYCNTPIDANTYIKMAKNDLEDPDYCGEASERAYHNARERIKYNNSSL